MKIVYSLPHPADRLDSEQAGHTIRASAMLNALETLGHEVIRVQAARGESGSQAAVSTYRTLVKKLFPRFLAMRLRDVGRVAFSRRYAERLTEVVQRERPDILLETHIAFSLAGKLASEKTGCPLVYDDVAPAWEEQQQYGVGASKLAEEVHREVTGHASLLVAVSAAIRQLLIDDGIPASKIITVSNGIQQDAFHPDVDGHPVRAKYGIDPQALVIVFVGSFQPYHRVDLLLRAFAKLQSATPLHLLLVGGDRGNLTIQGLADELGILDRTTFTGRIPYKEIANYAAAGDIAIMPATNTYGNPMKIYEYMALGKAVVAPNQPTITEITNHDNGIYLFEPEQVQSMAEALQTLIDDPALRARLGQQAAQIGLEHTWLKRATILQNAMLAIVQKQQT